MSSTLTTINLLFFPMDRPNPVQARDVAPTTVLRDIVQNVMSQVAPQARLQHTRVYLLHGDTKTELNMSKTIAELGLRDESRLRLEWTVSNG